MIPIRTNQTPSISYELAALQTQKTEIPPQAEQPQIEEQKQKKSNTKRKYLEKSATAEPEPKKTYLKDLLIPTVLPALCNIPWTPPSPEARTALVLMQYKQLTAIQIESSILHNLLTSEQLRKILSCHSKYTNYSSRRIIYISTESQEKTEIDPQQKWAELFTAKVAQLSSIPEPQSTEEYKNFCRSNKEQRRIKRQIDKDLQPLLSKLESGTINYKEYHLLRTSFLKIQSKSLAPRKSLFFPGVSVCNDPQYGKIRKFINPIFLLASTAFLSIVPKQPRTAQVLNIEQNFAIQKLQNGDFISLMELEEAASFLSPSIHVTKLKKLINHSLTILEQKGVLPLTGPINDVTKHNNNESTTSSNTNQEPPPSKAHTTPITQKQPIKRTLKFKYQKPKIPLKILHMDWAPQTTSQKSALLALQRKKLSGSETEIHLSTLAQALDKPRFIQLILDSKHISLQQSQRILHLNTKRTPKPNSPSEDVWNEMFTSHKNDPLPHPTSQHLIEEYYLNKEHFTKMLPEKLVDLFNKIETYSISYREYTTLKSSIQKISHTIYLSSLNLFFPRISDLNALEINSSVYIPKAFENSSRAYFSTIPHRVGIAKLMTEEEKLLMLRMHEGMFRSLQELEHAASILFHVLGRDRFATVLNNAAAIMENNGILPISDNCNDTLHQYQESEEPYVYTGVPAENLSNESQTTRQTSPLPLFATGLNNAITPASDNCNDTLYQCQKSYGEQYVDTGIPEENLSHESQITRQPYPLPAFSTVLNSTETIMENNGITPIYDNCNDTLHQHPTSYEEQYVDTGIPEKNLSHESQVTRQPSPLPAFSTVLNNTSAIMENNGITPIYDNCNDTLHQHPTSYEEQYIDTDIEEDNLSRGSQSTNQPLPLPSNPPHIDLLLTPEQQMEEVICASQTTTSLQDQLSVLSSITTLQTITTETTPPECDEIATREILTIVEDIGYTCAVENQPHYIDEDHTIDLTQNSYDTKNTPPYIYPHDPNYITQEDHSNSTDSITVYYEPPTSISTIQHTQSLQAEKTNYEESEQKTSDYAPTIVTRSMTADPAARTRGSEHTQSKSLSINSRQGSARTRPRRRRNAKTSRITQAISISLIGQYIHRQALGAQYIDNTSDEQKLFMFSLGLKSKNK